MSGVIDFSVDFEAFAKRLLAWYQRNQRDLPWRNNSEPYRVWLSEVMLQQTQVTTMLPYYEKFLERYPTVEHLASATLEDVLSLWSGLGYYSRARNLHRSARLIRDKYNGRFPDQLDEALALPGVGDYTARAILSVAYGQAHPVVDGNVRRVLSRFLYLRESDRSRLDKILWALLEERIAATPVLGRQISDFNQALMELGALICTPRNPGCDSCPLKEDCRVLADGDPHKLPLPRKARASRRLHFLCAVICEDGRYLLIRNKKDPFLKGFWEFPKVEGSPEEAELSVRFEAIGLELDIERIASPVRHQITFRSFQFYPCVGRLRSPPSLQGEAGWFDPARDSIPVSSYIGKIRERVETG